MSTTGTEAIDEEIAREKAESLGLAARLLETALRDLREHDAHAGKRSDPSGTIRNGLVARAAYRVQNVIIQREALGLRDPRDVFVFYSVPPEIVARIGVRER
jgi:hypothetical protein